MFLLQRRKQITVMLNLPTEEAVDQIIRAQKALAALAKLLQASALVGPQVLPQVGLRLRQDHLRAVLVLYPDHLEQDNL